jgi:hypothetical protein
LITITTLAANRPSALNEMTARRIDANAMGRFARLGSIPNRTPAARYRTNVRPACVWPHNEELNKMVASRLGLRSNSSSVPISWPSRMRDPIPVNPTAMNDENATPTTANEKKSPP